MVASNMILLDQLLAQYGPEARQERELLRLSVGPLVEEIWGPDRAPIHPKRPFTPMHRAHVCSEAPRHVSKDRRPALDPEPGPADCRRYCEGEIAVVRGGQIATARPFLVIVMFWLTMLFVSFSLFSPLNPTSIGPLVIIAISASAALFLILELSEPFSGLMQIPPSPLTNALAPLGP
jgi:hypothetical protein